MIYGSVCSGIEAATVAWHPLGWQPAWFSEIEKFPCAVLDHHYPDTPNLGDMNNFKEWPHEPIDILVGGTPCQSFSVAGLRKGLDDPRGNLALVYLAIAERMRPEWLVWENVPGVLSSNDGRDFGAFLGALVKLGYGFAYRVLDAQYFGVPQRRRRVFVVGSFGDWRPAAAVLFERYCLSGDSPPGQKSGEGIAPTLAARTKGGGGLGTDFDLDGGLIVIQERAASENPENGPSGRGWSTGGVAYTLEARQTSQSIAFDCRGSMVKQGVRRLTPKECERLQGFPDDYTLIPWRGKSAKDCPDGPRYKALGNSMAVPVMRWIGERINMFAEGSQKGEDDG